MTLRWPVVLFDFDGTVVNTVNLIVGGYQAAFTTVLGHPWDEAEIRSWIGRALTDTLTAVAPDQAEALAAAYHAYNAAHWDDATENYPGVPELLWDLLAAGVRTGIVTSRATDSAHRILGITGLTELIPVLAGRDATTRHKPHPDPLLKAISLLDVDPATVVYVGDAVVDIQAAQAAGIASIAVTWGAGTTAGLTAQQPDHIVHSAAELRQLLLPET